jgi:hypothetical protein
MKFDVDSTNEYLVWSNTHSITITSYELAPQGNFTYPVTVVTRRAPTFKEIASSGGKYTSRDVVWIMPAVLVQGAGGVGNRQPKVADFVNGDDGITYTVLSADLQVEYTQWRLTTRDIILAYNLYDTITIQRWPIVTDNAGSLIYTGIPTAVITGLQCAIKETTAAGVQERGKKIAKRTFSVWVSQQLMPNYTPQNLDQVVDQSNNIYELVGWSNPGAIDQLMELRVERRGW